MENKNIRARWIPASGFQGYAKIFRCWTAKLMVESGLTHYRGAKTDEEVESG